jgi:hypothetical protein
MQESKKEPQRRRAIVKRLLESSATHLHSPNVLSVQKIEKIVDLLQFLMKQLFKLGDLKLKVQPRRPALFR